MPRWFHPGRFFGGISVSNFMFGGTASHRGA
jgi:hypothetical protein